MKTDSDGQEKGDIVRLCADAGFPLAGVHEEGDVLVLIPERLDRLPEASVLRQLARKLQQQGHRHVAFSVEEEE